MKLSNKIVLITASDGRLLWQLAAGIGGEAREPCSQARHSEVDEGADLRYGKPALRRDDMDRQGSVLVRP
jgi:hypothetical protein